MKWATLGCVVHACWEVQGVVVWRLTKGLSAGCEWLPLGAGPRVTRGHLWYLCSRCSMFYVLMILDVTVQVKLQQRTKAK